MGHAGELTSFSKKEVASRSLEFVFLTLQNSATLNEAVSTLEKTLGPQPELKEFLISKKVENFAIPTFSFSKSEITFFDRGQSYVFRVQVDPRLRIYHRGQVVEVEEKSFEQVYSRLNDLFLVQKIKKNVLLDALVPRSHAIGFVAGVAAMSSAMMVAATSLNGYIRQCFFDKPESKNVKCIFRSDSNYIQDFNTNSTKGERLSELPKCSPDGKLENIKTRTHDGRSQIYSLRYSNGQLSGVDLGLEGGQQIISCRIVEMETVADRNEKADLCPRPGEFINSAYSFPLTRFMNCCAQSSCMKEVADYMAANAERAERNHQLKTLRSGRATQ
jgi:hypothetical protein